MNFDSPAHVIPILNDNDLEDADRLPSKLPALVPTSSSLARDTSDEHLFGQCDTDYSPSASVAAIDNALHDIIQIRKKMSRTGVSVVKREALLVNRRVEAYKIRCAKRRTMQGLQKNNICRSSQSRISTDDACVSKASSDASANFSDAFLSDSLSISLSSTTKSMNLSQSDNSSQDQEEREKDAESVVLLNSPETDSELSLTSMQAERVAIIDQAQRMNRMSMLLRLINESHRQFLEELIECKKAAVSYR